MSKTVLVGCRIPFGIVLDGSRGQPIELNGTNTAMIAGGVGLTHVDSTEWLYLSATYAIHAPFVSNAVFAFKASDKVADVAALAGDLAGVRTGFEGLDPTRPAPGLEPEDKGKLRQEMNKNAGINPAAKKAASAADQAAAAELATNMDR